MRLTDFYAEVSRRTDTAKTKINAAETSRVLSEAFAVLAGMNAAEANDLISKGLTTAAKKSAPKKKAAKKTTRRKTAKK